MYRRRRRRRRWRNKKTGLNTCSVKGYVLVQIEEG
jgi:hypothetical protein